VLLLIGISFLLAFLTLGAFKAGIEQVLPRSAWLAKQLRYSAPSDDAVTEQAPSMTRQWDIGRASRRYLLLVAVVVFVLGRRQIPWSALTREGFARRQRTGAHLAYGIAVALGLISLYTGVLLASTGAVLNPPPALYLGTKLVEYLCAAALIAMVEELFFRGVVFRSMLQEWGTGVALAVSSVVYGLVHCVSGSYRVAFGAQPLVGLKVAEAYLTDGAGSVIPALRLVIGLTLLGVLSAYLYIRTGTLWASVGLHGGLVLSSKLMKKLIDRSPATPEWLFGDVVFIVSGVLCWALLLLAALVVWRTAPSPDNS